jgi:hypothetical protein
MKIERFPVDDVHRPIKRYLIEYKEFNKDWQEILFPNGTKVGIVKCPDFDEPKNKSIAQCKNTLKFI